VTPVAAPTSKNRPILLVGAALVVAFALFWTFGSAKKPEATTEAKTSAHPIETVTGQTPQTPAPTPVAEKPPAPVASPPSTEPVAAEAKPAPGKPRAARPAPKPKRPPLGVAKGSSTASTEDTLFSGRK
jgi:hypothetical protein